MCFVVFTIQLLMFMKLPLWANSADNLHEMSKPVFSEKKKKKKKKKCFKTLSAEIFTQSAKG